MKVGAVICEFNPFHNGHKHLINKIKEQHADCVVAIMSGSFVQRGDIAIIDKYSRAQFALKNGCDLVVELPTVFALSSAQNFAKGGVEIAKAIGAHTLCFGAENADIEILSKVADAFLDDRFCCKLKEYIASGEYYPKAVSLSIKDTYGNEYADILNKANNTLAVEYIKALKNSNISPIAIKRLGVEHDSDSTYDNIASATHIRNLIKSGECYNAFTDMNLSNYTDIKNLETAILYKLRTMSKKDIENLPDVNEGLHNRIFECARNNNSLEELFENLKTKRYTLSRLRRIVMCALLDITKEHIKQSPKYIRVLGMNDNGAKILKSTPTLPIIAKVRNDYKKLSSDAKEQFDIDVRASEIFSLGTNDKCTIQNDFSEKLIKI